MEKQPSSRLFPAPSTQAASIFGALGVATAAVDPDAVTVDQLVTAPIEPWVHAPDEWTPPSDKEWTDDAPYLLPYARMAWAVMYKTRSELEDVSRNLDDEPFKKMVDGIVNAQKFFQNFVTILSSAELRIMCSAASALAKDDPEEWARAAREAPFDDR
jgi:hypothetical protein